MIWVVVSSLTSVPLSTERITLGHRLAGILVCDFEGSVDSVHCFQLYGSERYRNLHLHGAKEVLIGQDMTRYHQVFSIVGKSHSFRFDNQMILANATIELQRQSIIALVDKAWGENRNPKYNKCDTACGTMFVRLSISQMNVALRSYASFGHTRRRH